MGRIFPSNFEKESAAIWGGCLWVIFVGLCHRIWLGGELGILGNYYTFIILAMNGLIAGGVAHFAFYAEINAKRLPKFMVKKGETPINYGLILGSKWFCIAVAIAIYVGGTLFLYWFVRYELIGRAYGGFGIAYDFGFIGASALIPSLLAMKVASNFVPMARSAGYKI